MKRIAITILLAAISLGAHAADLYGRVVGVTDGDTLTLLDSANVQHKIRLFAIDSPETSCHHGVPSASAESCVERGQPFGKTAKRSLSDMVYGRDVRIVLRSGESYGRKIGTVWVGQVDVNLQQVARGMAWHYRKYALREQSNDEFGKYSEAEMLARSRAIGLWAAPQAVAPWDYRKTARRP